MCAHVHFQHRISDNKVDCPLQSEETGGVESQKKKLEELSPKSNHDAQEEKGKKLKQCLTASGVSV